jgi:hypothetical protein
MNRFEGMMFLVAAAFAALLSLAATPLPLVA